MIGLLLVLGFLILLLIGVPIAFALLIPAICYVILTGMPISMVAHVITHSLNSFPLLAVPLFILVGNLMNHSGITTRLFRFASSLVSQLKGGLCHINILMSLVFSGSSGAALADIGGIGNMQIKSMKEDGYKPEFAASITIASATVGPIFPPSIPLIIFATVAEVSAVNLLLAGIIPALLIVLLLMITTAFLAWKRDYPAGKENLSLMELLLSFIEALPALLTPIVLIAGMLLGIFTATEAAAVTVVYILAINLFIYKEFSWKSFMDSTRDTVKTTSVLMIMVSTAALFTRILALENIPQESAQFLVNLTDDIGLLILISILVLLFAGMFLESISALVLLTPIIVPPLVMLGADPVHVGVIVVYTLMLGLLTPPLGLSLFLVSDIANVAVEDILKELLPWYIPLVIGLFAIAYLPDLSLWILSIF